jgi:hypothetical protein
MPLNKALIDAINNRPHADEPDVAGGYVGQLTAERPTTSELAVNGDIEELRRRCEAELSPAAFDLASAWAFAADLAAGDADADREPRLVAAIAKHFPGLEMAIRAAYDHVQDELTPDGLKAWPACCRWLLDGAEDSDPAA